MITISKTYKLGYRLLKPINLTNKQHELYSKNTLLPNYIERELKFLYNCLCYMSAIVTKLLSCLKNLAGVQKISSAIHNPLVLARCSSVISSILCLSHYVAVQFLSCFRHKKDVQP